ncbi:tRNA (guanine(26)-N(2))-dimethyltransferase [Mercurialis annua]|uniref:tRNA (guanine(26)-N(2))-dimethyltransferase n=1 Tax=Mercurialis annua TaxID=3986 RepID=UPI002160F377|nr:tRNA (guanine(26)-N(2))-dimethyltransferase [Mercurialis annua]
MLALSLSSFLYKPLQNPNQNQKVPIFKPQFSNFHCNSELQTERGIEFETGESFFRHESAKGRDLGVLAGAIYKKSKGTLRVIDAMCGCGIRSCRYLIEAEADFVLANDANDEYRGVIVGNLKQVERGFGDERRWVVTHSDANRVLSECYLQRDFFDLIDVDSFGSDNLFLRNAMSSLKLDGLLYLTSTDGYSSGGHRPNCSLAAYGAYIRPMPCANEVGLRMLIGGAVREASLLGYHVTPLFSYYSYHGPVFRVMLRVNQGKEHENRHYGFISYCKQCGNTRAFSWQELGRITCSFCSNEDYNPLTVSGPLWTGPLHDATFITEMLILAEQWGWIGEDGVGSDLDKLLKQMLDESDPRLPFGYIKLDQMASRAKINSPSIKTLMSTLLKEGYVASRSHIASNAIKTDCPMPVLVRLATELQGAK